MRWYPYFAFALGFGMFVANALPGGSWLWATVGALVAFFYGTQAFRVRHIMGIALPWVRTDA